MFQIACTRFTEGTLIENFRYRETRAIPCIYGSPIPTNEKYSADTHFFVVEMNNTTNQIVGIGFVQNKPCKDRTYIIHDMTTSVCNYNRYIFKGDKWIPRDQLPASVIEIFDKILFKGKSHLKRIRGVSVVTNKLFSRWEYNQAEIIEQMKTLFEI